MFPSLIPAMPARRDAAQALDPGVRTGLDRPLPHPISSSRPGVDPSRTKKKAVPCETAFLHPQPLEAAEISLP